MSELIVDGKFEYTEQGEGPVLMLLHGLFGEMSNFEDTINHFSKDYRVIAPLMPLYKTKLKVGVGAFANYIEDFINHFKLEDINLLGNSLGGHVALVYANRNPEKVKTLILTGSSGLYEKAFGSDYPRKDDKEFLRKRISVTFYDQSFVTDELVDQCHSLVNDRAALINILRIAKSAIKHNMEEDLPNFKMPTLLIWGKNDNITPPDVAVKFDELIPDSTLKWIDKCGHAPMMEHPQEFNDKLEEWITNTTNPIMMFTKKAEFVMSNSDIKFLPKPKLPEYAFIGRSNVGKSSLINSLCNNKKLAKTSSTPGKTQLINHFLIDEEWYLVDLPGYGYTKTPKHLRRKWQNFTRNYLRTRENLMCVFLLIDSRHKPLKPDTEFMEWLGENRIPFVIVFTKTDKLSSSDLAKNVKSYSTELYKTWDFLPQMFKTSAETKFGNQEVLSFVSDTNKMFTPVEN